MHSFEVRSNESACRKSGRLGLEQVCATIKRININKLQVRMILRARKRLRACPKRNKRHVMVMFAFIMAENTYYIQRMNARAQNMRWTSVT